MEIEDTRYEIWLNGEFNQKNCLDLRQKILVKASNFPNVPIIIYINSYGGEVDSLNMVLDTLDSIPNKIITVCAGTAMSAAAVLLSHGDERYITKNSRIMIHKVSSWAHGNIDDIENDTKETTRLNKGMLEILAKNTKKSLKELEAILSRTRDLYLNPKSAIKFKIADKIGFPILEELKLYTIKTINRKNKD